MTLADSRVRARNRFVARINLHVVKIELYLCRNLPDGPGALQQAETRNRSVRIRNLPAATQEGILQQVLERYALVKRVEVFQDKNEAVIELDTAAVCLQWWPRTLLFVLINHIGGWKASFAAGAYYIQRYAFGTVGREPERTVTHSTCCTSEQNGWTYGAKSSSLQTEGRPRATEKKTGHWRKHEGISSGHRRRQHATVSASARPRTRWFSEDVKR